MAPFIFRLIALALIFNSTTALGQDYIQQRQNERYNHRWTIQDWLVTQPKIRAVDQQRSVLTNSAKAGFKPEMNVRFGAMRGVMNINDGSGSSEKGSLEGSQGKVQLWLTNALSTAIAKILNAPGGVKTLNIDMGLEGFARSANNFESESASSNLSGDSLTTPLAAASTQESTSGNIDTSRELETNYHAATFRLFGKNIQDTSLILKYGKFQTTNALPTWTDESEEKSFNGIVKGAEMNLYLSSFMGLEGNLTQYEDDNSGDVDSFSGEYYDYSAFVELSLIRLMVGSYREEWQFSDDVNSLETSERGFLAGTKLQF